MKITFTEILFIDNKLFKKIFIGFFISFIILFSNDFVFAHGGEEHGEHKEKPDTQSTSKNIDLGFIKTEKIINNKNGAFKIIFEQRPKIIYQGDRVNFTFHVLEIIENSFIEPENIELKNINVSNDRLLNINIKKNVNNFYSFDLVFDKNANLELNIIDINNNKLKYNFNIDIVKLPINYTFYTLIIIILITLIIYTICFIRKSNSFSQKIVIISLNIIMLIISVILISYLLPLRIKHPIQVSKELNQNIKINTNDVFVNKETQLLFDIKTQTIHKKNVSDSINIFGTIKPFSQDRGDIISPVSGRVYLNSLFFLVAYYIFHSLSVFWN